MKTEKIGQRLEQSRERERERVMCAGQRERERVCVGYWFTRVEISELEGGACT